MSYRGSRPKPTVQKMLEGNPGKRRLNHEEPQPPPIESTTFDEPPEEFAENEVAQKEWRRLAPMLRRCRQITEADRSALTAVCLQWSLYLDAMKQIKRLGLVVKSRLGSPIVNPYLHVAAKALHGCNRLWPELGLTPSSRSRIKMDTSSPVEGDAFTEFDLPPVLPTDRDEPSSTH